MHKRNPANNEGSWEMPSIRIYELCITYTSRRSRNIRLKIPGYLGSCQSAAWNPMQRCNLEKVYVSVAVFTLLVTKMSLYSLQRKSQRLDISDQFLPSLKYFNK